MGKTKQKTKVIALTKLPKQIGRKVIIDGHSIALFRLNSGDIRAIGSKCPHTNGPLAEGIVSGEYVYCPLQNWKVSLVTGKVQAPNHGIVNTYETEIIDGFVYVTV